MRINMYQGEEESSAILVDSNNVALGNIRLINDPVYPMEAASKGYVDSVLRNLSASNITSGVLAPEFLPAFTGVATSDAGSNVFTLEPSGVTPGRYTRVTVDAKGRVTSGSNIVAADIPNMAWGSLTLNMPTTLAGYGIVDALSTSGGIITQNLVMSEHPLVPTQAATKGYVASVISAPLPGPVPGPSPSPAPSPAPPPSVLPGTVVQIVNGAPTVGYLRANGSNVSKVDYAALYTAIGDQYNASNYTGAGKPWKQQYDINITQSTDITGWTTGTSLPGPLAYSQAVVTKNRVYLLGGTNSPGTVSTVYTASITGSLNDYSPYYDGTISDVPADQFSLPMLEDQNVAGSVYYIKT